MNLALGKLPTSDLDLLCKYHGVNNIADLADSLGTVGTMPSDEWFAAARNGDLETIKRLVDEGIDINVKNMYGNTALYYIIDGGYTNAVGYLVENGAYVNISDNDGYTPLSAAAYKGNTDIVRYLVENGANVNTSDKYGKTPLSKAAYMGRTDIVRYLVDHGAEKVFSRTWSHAAKNRREILRILKDAVHNRVANSVNNGDRAMLQKIADKACYNLQKGYNLEEVRSIAEALNINTTAIDRSSKEELCALISAKIIISQKEPSMRNIALTMDI